MTICLFLRHPNTRQSGVKYSHPSLLPPGTNPDFLIYEANDESA